MACVGLPYPADRSRRANESETRPRLVISIDAMDGMTPPLRQEESDWRAQSATQQRSGAFVDAVVSELRDDVRPTVYVVTGSWRAGGETFRAIPTSPIRTTKSKDKSGAHAPPSSGSKPSWLDPATCSPPSKTSRRISAAKRARAGVDRGMNRRVIGDDYTGGG